jgi:site-specific DNA-methyltransferase (adenine-specific)
MNAQSPRRGEQITELFHTADWALEVAEQIDRADSMFYAPKAGRTERNAGLDELPDKVRHRVNSGGLENEPRWAPTIAKNNHPTVKPMKLTEYLARILCPPVLSGIERRLLVPFCGSGSEMIGGILAGWDHVYGIEASAEYIAIAEARLTYWMGRVRQQQRAMLE